MKIKYIEPENKNPYVKIIPTEFEEIDTLIPTDFIEYNGKIIPIKFEEGKKLVPVDYEILEV